jgi:NADH-quinone oxidoreductase subunit L
LGRNAVLFSHAPETMAIVAVIGAATALMAGHDRPGAERHQARARVLDGLAAGYMFLAMGVGAFGAGIFHLYTHAFFKACLFLGSGAVIHCAARRADIRNMGGLKRHLPITYWTFLIASLAIAGVPGLAGSSARTRSCTRPSRRAHVLWVIGILTSLLTATYMFRLVF